MSYNIYQTRMRAFSEARRNPPWNIFPHTRTETESTRPETYQAGSELERQPRASTGPAALSSPGVPSSSREPNGHALDSSRDGDSQPIEESGVGTAAVPQDGLRQRSSRTDRSVTLTSEQRQEEEKNEEKPKKSRTFFKHLTPKEPFTVRNQLERTLFNSWINVLLITAPVGIAINYVESIPRVAVFVVNFIAIIPLAAMLGFATEEIALRTGETLGGLLNATFGNAVELIVAVIALAHNEVVIVQTSLIGSILSNLLLVLGMCFFFGGLRRPEQYFNTTVAQTAASMLALAVASVIVPTVFDAARDTPASDVAKLSRGTSVILLVVYAGYLLFQLKTHSKVFALQSQKVEAKPFPSLKRAKSSPGLSEGAVAQGFVAPAGLMGGHGLISRRSQNEKIRELLTQPPPSQENSQQQHHHHLGDVTEEEKEAHEQENGEEEEGAEEPQLHFLVALGTLAAVTVVIALCAEFMVDSISAVTANGAVSAEFVGLILLPLVGNAAEHATAVTVACKDKMDLAIGVAVGSSMQVALFVIPLLVIIGWGMGVDAMSLSFDAFQVAVLFVAVLLVNYLIADGKSHWLEGMLLMCLYCIIAVCSWWYPTDQEVAGA